MGVGRVVVVKLKFRGGFAEMLISVVTTANENTKHSGMNDRQYFRRFTEYSIVIPSGYLKSKVYTRSTPTPTHIYLI